MSPDEMRAAWADRCGRGVAGDWCARQPGHGGACNPTVRLPVSAPTPEPGPLDLDALERLLAAATDGPWRVVLDDSESATTVWQVCTSPAHPAGDSDLVHDCCADGGLHGEPFYTEADAQLVAALRNAVPELIRRTREADRLVVENRVVTAIRDRLAEALAAVPDSHNAANLAASRREAKAAGDELEQMRAELRDRRTDALDIRGILWPATGVGDPVVPWREADEPALAPAIRRTADELVRSRCDRDGARDALRRVRGRYDAARDELARLRPVADAIRRAADEYEGHQAELPQDVVCCPGCDIASGLADAVDALVEPARCTCSGVGCAECTPLPERTGRWLATWSITGPAAHVAEQARTALGELASTYADAGPVKLRAELVQVPGGDDQCGVTDVDMPAWPCTRPRGHDERHTSTLPGLGSYTWGYVASGGGESR